MHRLLTRPLSIRLSSKGRTTYNPCLKIQIAAHPRRTTSRAIMPTVGWLLKVQGWKSRLSLQWSTSLAPKSFKQPSSPQTWVRSCHPIPRRAQHPKQCQSRKVSSHQPQSRATSAAKATMVPPVNNTAIIMGWGREASHRHQMLVAWCSRQRLWALAVGPRVSVFFSSTPTGQAPCPVRLSCSWWICHLAPSFYRLSKHSTSLSKWQISTLKRSKCKLAAHSVNKKIWNWQMTTSTSR